jgi:hypothetical protein
MTFEQVAQVFTRLHDRFGWRPIVEAGKTIGERGQQLLGGRGSSCGGAAARQQQQRRQQ